METVPLCVIQGFPGGSVGKESDFKAGDSGSISGLGRSPRVGNGNPLQYSCLENPGQRSLVATVHGVAESDTTKHGPPPPAMSKKSSSGLEKRISGNGRPVL